MYPPFSNVYGFEKKIKRVLHWVKDMGSEMFELCDTSHYFVFRLVGLTLINLENNQADDKVSSKKNTS